MTSFEKRNKTYSIRVPKGYDENKKRKPQSFMTWKPDDEMTQDEIEKELNIQMIEFQRKVDSGVITSGNITFADYAKNWLEYSEKVRGLEETTLRGYRQKLSRINKGIGNIRLDKLTTQDIKRFLTALTNESSRDDMTYIVDDLEGLLIKAKLRKVDIINKTDISKNTVTSISKGNAVSKDTIRKLSEYLKMKPDQISRPSKPEKKLDDLTVLHHYRLISAILNTATIEDNLIYQSPTERMRAPRVKEKEAAFLDLEEIELFVDFLLEAPIQYFTLFILAIYTGARRSELLGLEWDDIDFKHQDIFIRRASVYIEKKGIITKGAKTRKSKRNILEPDIIFGVLRVYKTWQLSQKEKTGINWVDSGRLFTKANGQPMHPDTPSNWLWKSLKEHPELQKTHLHAFRHSNASLQIASGIDISVVSQRLGHSKQSTTLNIYSHSTRDAEKAASDSLDRILDPIKQKILVKYPEINTFEKD